MPTASDTRDLGDIGRVPTVEELKAEASRRAEARNEQIAGSSLAAVVKSTAIKVPTNIDKRRQPNPTSTVPSDQEAVFRRALIDSELHSPSPPRAYAGLNVGADMAVEFEDNKTAPVDASKGILRSLSPFVIQVEPPLVMNLAPSATSGANVDVGLYNNAAKQRGSFQNARNALSNSTFVQGNLGASGPADEIIARGNSKSSGGTTNRTADSNTDASGYTSRGKLGEPAIADLQTAVDVTLQLRSILSTPPLVLLINPQSLAMSFSKIQQYSDRSRHGYIFHSWGEEQPKLSVEMKCGAFMSGQRGVQYASKRDSAAWQNLMTAFQFYRNNGYIYDTVGKTFANHFVGALSIQYDQWTYYGHMQSFSMSQDDTSTVLGGVSVSLEFVVSSMVDSAPVTLNVQPMRTITGAASAHGRNLFNLFDSPAEGRSQQPIQALPSTGAGNLRSEDGTAAVDPNVRTGQSSGSRARTPIVGVQTVVPRGRGGWVPENLDRGFATGVVTLADPGRSKPFEGVA